MGHGEFFILALILCILSIQVSAYDESFEDDEDEYRQLKRFLFHKASTTTSSNVIGNLIRPATTASTSTWTYRTAHSTANPSSGACKSNSCEHGGICIPKGQMTYDCKCVGAWRGIYCGVADACYNRPCQNGGTCLNVYDDFWCQCTNDYYGKNCQTKFTYPGTSDNNCRPNICNTGRCVSLKTTYYCQCPDDRYGEHCEKRFSKRKVSKRHQYYQNIRNMNRQYDNDAMENQNAEERAYYDFKNGIYF